MLLNVVVVEGKRELLGGIAHAVCAIRTSAGVGDNPGTDTVPITADFTKQLTVRVIVGVRRNNTAQRRIHAAAELLIGSRRQRRGHGIPIAALGRTGRWRVSRSVCAHCNATGRHVRDLAGIVVKILVGRDSVATDRDKP